MHPPTITITVAATQSANSPLMVQNGTAPDDLFAHVTALRKKKVTKIASDNISAIFRATTTHLIPLNDLWRRTTKYPAKYPATTQTRSAHHQPVPVRRGEDSDGDEGQDHDDCRKNLNPCSSENAEEGLSSTVPSTIFVPSPPSHSDRTPVDSPSEKKVAEPEASFKILTNPARVVPAQEKYIKFIEESRYVPVKLAPSRFVLLRDLRPTEPEVLSLTDAPSSTTSPAGESSTGQEVAASAMAVDEEPQPPQPFEYTS